MSTHKHIDLLCVAVLICTVLITVLFMNGERYGLTPIIDWDSENSTDSPWFTRNDRDGDWDDSGATRIVLKGDTAVVHGGGAYAYDGDVIIAQAGRYVLSGALTDGSVIVSADSTSKVWIKLDGVEISCSDDACIRADQADKVFLTLAADSENSLTSGAEYSEAAVADKRGGVVFSHDDLTVNGSGTLYVTAGCKHGFDVNDELVITGGTITIDAPQDGLHANDGLRIENTEFTIRAGDEGFCLQDPDTLLVISSGSFDIQSVGAGVKCAGNLLVEGGTLKIESEGDAVQCEGSAEIAKAALSLNAGDEGIRLLGADSRLTVRSGSFDIQSGGAGIKCAGGLRVDGGTFDITSGTDAVQCEGSADLSRAAFTLNAGDEGIRLLSADSLLTIHSGSFDIQSTGAGVKCEGELLIQGGTFRLTTEGDAIHAAGAVMIEDGTFSISSGDDGIHADTSVTIRGGSVQIDKCYEGIEAKTIEIAGGEIEIYPTDDGLNANGGSFGFGPPGMMMGQTANIDDTEDEECWIRVSGGSLTVVNENARDADGLDSNGDIFISGGVIRVSLTGDGGNNAIDFGSESGGACEISGGEIVACGGSAMAEAVSESSTQCSVMYNLSTLAPAGTSVRLLDMEGREILSYTVPCSFTSVTLSSPEMKQGESYIMAVGTQEETITLENVSGTYGEKKGGNMGWGGLRNRDGRADMMNGERPGMNGERPDFANMSPPPEMSGERPEWPGMNGERSGFANMSPPPEMNGDRPTPSNQAATTENPEPEQTPEAEEAPDETAPVEETAFADEMLSGPKPVSKAAWIVVGACLFALLAGILFAVKYRV